MQENKIFFLFQLCLGIEIFGSVFVLHRPGIGNVCLCLDLE